MPGIDATRPRKRAITAETSSRRSPRGFKVIGFANRRSQKCGITTIAIESEEKAVALAKKLRDNRIDISLRQTRSGISCIRLSPHFYNTEAEIEEVIKIMAS